ncbi:Transmembrane protease serine 9 [Varanus komodoensis]|nr:Transmembrane protease serine 9 [Varanus komodoensis]
MLEDLHPLPRKQNRAGAGGEPPRASEEHHGSFCRSQPTGLGSVAPIILGWDYSPCTSGAQARKAAKVQQNPSMTPCHGPSQSTSALPSGAQRAGGLPHGEGWRGLFPPPLHESPHGTLYPTAVPCTPSTFQCSSKVCIGKANPECDGVADCGNGRDETNCDCGLTPAPALGKIVGGSGAGRTEWPWQASLRLRHRDHRCGAVLVAERWLLSAAHCFDAHGDPKLWEAQLGTTFLSGPSGHVERIAQIRKHPFYNLYTLDYDVALLQLPSPLRYSSTIKPICLPDSSHVFAEGRHCIITGWGSTKEGGLLSKQLQKAAVRVIGEQACRRFYPVQISSRMACAGLPHGTVDSCSGDAGGPLACQEPSGHWFLAGITSWGYGCGRPHFPGVYTKVTAVRSWLGQSLNV